MLFHRAGFIEQQWSNGQVDEIMDCIPEWHRALAALWDLSRLAPSSNGIREHYEFGLEITKRLPLMIPNDWKRRWHLW
jgi:hypothetical protein